MFLTDYPLCPADVRKADKKYWH